MQVRMQQSIWGCAMALLCIIIIIGTGMTTMAVRCRGGCGGWRLALLVCGARGSACLAVAQQQTSTTAGRTGGGGGDSKRNG